MSIIYLKVKIISLADEARTIRIEEKRLPGESTERVGLYLHRIQDVRWEARSAQLAYGFLRGRPYKQLEHETRKPLDLKRIAELAKKYGPGYSNEPKDSMLEQIRGWAIKDTAMVKAA